MLGYDESALLQHNCLDVTHPDDKELFQRLTALLLTGDCTTVKLEKRYLHEAGLVVWARVHITLVRDDDRKPLYFLFQSEDITGQHEQAMLLRRAEERFRAAFGTTTIGMAILSTDGRYLEVNATYCAMFGYTESELLGASVGIIVPPEVRAMGLTTLRNTTHVPMSSYDGLRCVHKDGHAVYIRLATTVVDDDDGQPLYFVGQAQDITELRRVEQEQRAGQARLEAVIAHAPIAINVVDAQGVFTFSGGAHPYYSA